MSVERKRERFHYIFHPHKLSRYQFNFSPGKCTTPPILTEVLPIRSESNNLSDFNLYFMSFPHHEGRNEIKIDNKKKFSPNKMLQNIFLCAHESLMLDEQSNKNITQLTRAYPL
jgi:hypothetical protein